MNFCSQCGNSVEFRVPAGDNRLRYVCDRCGTIHYQNPRLVVGTIPILENRVLLCRRAIEPRYGYWTLPAGFMENGESTSEGAERETSEEAGARIRIGELFSIIDVPHVEQVHLFFLATMLDDQLNPGSETLETRFCTEEEIPWRDIAFRTVAQTLRWYFEDRRSGQFNVHASTMRPDARPAG